MSTIVRALVRTFWVLLGEQEPGRLEKFAARYPGRLTAATWVCCAVFCLLVGGNVQPPDIVVGFIIGAFVGLAAWTERLRQRRLRYRNIWDDK